MTQVAEAEDLPRNKHGRILPAVCHMLCVLLVDMGLCQGTYIQTESGNIIEANGGRQTALTDMYNLTSETGNML